MTDPTVEICFDDLRSPKIAALLKTHLAQMCTISQTESTHTRNKGRGFIAGWCIVEHSLTAARSLYAAFALKFYSSSQNISKTPSALK